MEKEILFSEKQKFRQWWIWLILIFINGMFLVGLFMQSVLNIPFGNKPMGLTELVIVTIIMLLFTFFFMNMRLDTLVKSDGIYVRFYPIHLSFKFYPWQDLIQCYIREYHPIKEYGGWGIRVGLYGKGRAYNVSGKMGLQLEFQNKKKLLIGTQKPQELEDVLKQINTIKQK